MPTCHVCLVVRYKHPDALLALQDYSVAMASTFLSVPSVSPSATMSVQDKCKMKSGTSFRSAFFGKDKQQPLSMKPKSHGRVTMTVATKASRFDSITMAPPDPILGVSEAFKADTSELKLNLGVGAYRTEELQPYVLKTVRKAENLMLEMGENKVFLPIKGLAAFNKATTELLFGVIHEQRVATIQGNHKNIFNDAKLPWSEYRYYDPKTVGLDFDGMIEDIKVISQLLYKDK
ncbi:hypothetical protein LXL04_025004 [Taraxacum kok-saghyz]